MISYVSIILGRSSTLLTYSPAMRPPCYFAIFPGRVVLLHHGFFVLLFCLFSFLLVLFPSTCPYSQTSRSTFPLHLPITVSSPTDQLKWGEGSHEITWVHNGLLIGGTPLEDAELTSEYKQHHANPLHMCVCMPCVCLVPQRPEEGARSPETEVGWIWALIWVLGTKPRSSGKATSASLCWDIYSAP